MTTSAGIKCPNCGHSNRPGSMFCAVCGTNLLTAPSESETHLPAGDLPSLPLPPVVFCKNCGSANNRLARFCDTCAAPIVLSPLIPVEPSLGLKPDEIAVGSVLAGRYNVISVIDRGGMGSVYRALDKRLQTVVAVKEMTPGWLDPADRLEFSNQFRQEARLLARLTHPAIARVIDYFEESNKEFLVMELVEGETLDRVVERRGVLPESQVLAWASQMMEVVEYLHNQTPPIIHRDIKPSNFMLLSGEKIKLIDFGIARIFKPDRSADTAAFGTPGYAAPEQYGGRGQTDPRSDIFSLGATLFQLLTGYDVVGGPVFMLPPARQVNPALSPNTEAVLTRATQLDPTQRFQSIAEMRRALMAGTAVNVSPAPLLKTVMASSPPSHRRSIYLPLILLLSGAIILLMVTPVREGIVNYVGEAASRVIFWLTVNWRWVFLALAAGVAVASRRIIASAVSSVGNAIRHQRVRPSRPSPTIPPPPRYPPQPPASSDFQPSADRPSMRLRPEHTGWTSRAKKHVIEDLILQEDFERLKSFIADSQGGRFVLTGYGRFGGTSLVKGAISKARRELQHRGLSEGALLVFYFNVKDSIKQTGEFAIQANEFSFGKLTTQYESAVTDSGYEALKARANRVEPSSLTSPAATCHFSLTTPLSESFFSRSGLTGLFVRQAVSDLDFTKLVTDLDNFFAEGKSNSELQEIVLRLVGSEVLPSRVIIILDRICRLETLEHLARFDLFKNERITVIAIARKEEFDQWESPDQRLNNIGFRKWYVPCLWQGRTDYVQRIEQTLLEPYGFEGSDVENPAVSLRKHLELVGKGALGDVLEELKHPQYWSSDGGGSFYLRLDALPHNVNIQHNAWMQDVLSLNWPAILSNLFAGKDMDEREDRARIGVLHLLDWIARQQMFTKDQLLEDSNAVPITISDNSHVVIEVVQNLLHVLGQNRYLRLMNGQYRVTWNKSKPPKPRKVSVRTESSQPSLPPLPPLEEDSLDAAEPDQPADVVPPISEVRKPDAKKVIFFSETEGAESKKWEIAIEEPKQTTERQSTAKGEPGVNDKTRILVVFANPKGSDPLRLGEEDRIIHECLKKARNRDNLHPEILHAARAKDVQLALVENDYHVVHFSGHATPSGNLAFEDEVGKTKLISQQALANLLANFPSIECVLLNACYTVKQGQLLSLGVPFTIAMDGPISDDAAKHFTRGFYDTIGAGRDYSFAYKMGCSAIDIEAPVGQSEASKPKLIEKI
ncbi:MAG: protein kinase [Caldilineales bacterium]|nr:protein kinase [Caldilineales bacterium]